MLLGPPAAARRNIQSAKTRLNTGTHSSHFRQFHTQQGNSNNFQPEFSTHSPNTKFLMSTNQSGSSHPASTQNVNRSATHWYPQLHQQQVLLKNAAQRNFSGRPDRAKHRQLGRYKLSEQTAVPGGFTPFHTVT